MTREQSEEHLIQLYPNNITESIASMKYNKTNIFSIYPKVSATNNQQQTNK